MDTTTQSIIDKLKNDQTSSQAIQSIFDVLENGDTDIINIQNEITSITNSSNDADAFVKQMNIYKNYEVLVEEQLTQLQDFLESSDGLTQESVNITNIRIDIQKKLQSYSQIVEENNKNSVHIKESYENIKERINKLEQISNNISNVSYFIQEHSLNQRSNYMGFVDSIGYVSYPMVKKLPTKLFLTNNLVEFVMSDYFIDVSNAYQYQISTNIAGSATLTTNASGKTCLTIKGDYRDQMYSVTIKAINTAIVNKPGKLNYTFLSFPVEEDNTPPVPINSEFTVLDLSNAPQILALEDHFSFVKPNTTYSISFDENAVAVLDIDMLTLTGRNLDKYFEVRVIAIDSRNRESSQLVIKCKDLPKMPTLEKAFIDRVSNENVTFDLSEYITHDTFPLTYTFILNTDKSNSHVRIIGNNMTIEKSYRNESYTVYVTGKTSGANTINTQLTSEFILREPPSTPTINTVPYSTFFVNSSVNLSFPSGGMSQLFYLNKLFTSSGELLFDVSSTHSDYYAYNEANGSITFTSQYRDSTYFVVIVGSNEIGSAEVIINVTEMGIPAPIVKNGGLPSLHNIDGYFDTVGSIPLSSYFGGFEYNFATGAKTESPAYVLNVYDSNNNEINDGRVVIANNALVVAQMYNNMEIRIKVTAQNTTFSGEKQFVDSTLIFHENIQDIEVKKELGVTEFLTNVLQTYTLSEYFAKLNGETILYAINGTNMEGVSLAGGILTIQPNFRNRASDVNVVATRTRFDGVVKTSTSTLYVRENLHQVVRTYQSAIEQYIINGNFLAQGLTTFDLSQSFSGDNLSYAVSVYKDEALSIIDTEHTVSIFENNLRINGDLRNKFYYVKVTGSNTNYTGNTYSAFFAMRVKENIRNITLLSSTVSVAELGFERRDYILSDYFSGPDINYTYEMLYANGDPAPLLYVDVVIATNDTGNKLLRVTPNYRDMSYSVKVKAENRDFQGLMYTDAVSLVFPITELAKPVGYLQKITQTKALPDIALVGTQTIDLQNHFYNHTSMLVGDFPTLQTDMTLIADASFVSTKIDSTFNKLTLIGDYRNISYYVVVRLKNDDGDIFNVQFKVTETIKPPFITKNLSGLSVPLLSTATYTIPLIPDYFDGDSLTFRIVNVYTLVNAVEISTEHGVSIVNGLMQIVPNYRNKIYFVKVVARNTDHMGVTQETLPSILTVKENIFIPTGGINVAMKYIEDVPIEYNLNTIFSVTDIDFSYKIVNAALINVSIQLFDTIWKMIVYPNYRNKEYDIQVVASYTNFDNLNNDIAVNITVSETIAPPLIYKQLYSSGICVVFEGLKCVYDMNDFFKGPGLVFTIVSVSNVDADVTLVSNILEITGAGLGVQYNIVIQANNTNYLGEASIPVQSTLSVFEPTTAVGPQIEGTVDAVNEVPVISLVNEGLQKLGLVVMTSETAIYKLSDYFTGSQRVYDYVIKEVNGTEISKDLFNVVVFRDIDQNVSLQVIANYRDRYYNIEVTATSIKDANVKQVSVLRIVEVVEAPYIKGNGLAAESTLVLTNNLRTFNISEYFDGLFHYTVNSLKVFSKTNTLLSVSQHGASLNTQDGVLSIQGNYRNVEYFIHITVETSNVDNVYKFSSPPSILHVVEHIEPVRVA